MKHGEEFAVVFLPFEEGEARWGIIRFPLK
jgi:hypothetical protein